MLFSGSYVAVITPFNRKGQVDAKALEKLIEWHIQEGTEGIVCCGSTGEGIAMNDAERKKVASICINVSANRIPIIVGSGLAGTTESVRLTEKMQRLGATGCLVVTPYYNKPSQRGCIFHFEAIAKVGLPVIAYHNPARTGIKLTAETVARIGEIPGVAALKDSSSDLELIRQIRKISSIPILAGDDDITFNYLQEGCVGAISVIGNLFPKSWKKMIALSLTGKVKESKVIADRYASFCKALFKEANPQGVKFAMEWIGLAKGFLRLPLVRVTEETGKRIKSEIVSLALPHFETIKVQR